MTARRLCATARVTMEREAGKILDIAARQVA